MTLRLFETDSHLKLFEAEVIECIKEKNGYAVVLDKTAFFPEGGGQKGDSGLICSGKKSEDSFFVLTPLETEDGEVFQKSLAEGVVNVIDTQERAGIVYHYCNLPLNVGEKVTCLVDFDIRFRRMQNHTGEHIVSGIINKYYGYDNVGFHMGAEDVTLDINGILTKEDIEKVEKEANRAVFDNVPVYAEVFSGDALSGLEYRSKLDLVENVRIVTVEGYDKCACCAPHVSQTGEIGIIKILSFEPHKQGIRIHMICGFDALEDYERKLVQSKISCSMLSVKQNELSQGINRLIEENKKEKQESNGLKNIIAQLLIEKAVSQNKKCIFTEINDPVFLRYLANGGMEAFGTCFVFCNVSENNYRYVAASKEIDMRAFSKELNASLNGRGGGDNSLIQGSVNASEENIVEFVSLKV